MVEPASRREIVDCVGSPFLGYGRVNAPLWIVGTEEHGAEVRSGRIPGNKADFSSWYEHAPWSSYSRYAREVGAERARRLVQLALANREVRCIVSYSSAATRSIAEAWPGATGPTSGGPDGAQWWDLKRGRTSIALAGTGFWMRQYSNAKLLALAARVRTLLGR